MRGSLSHLGDINISLGICNWVYGVGSPGESSDIISFSCTYPRKNFCLHDYFLHADDKVYRPIAEGKHTDTLFN